MDRFLTRKQCAKEAEVEEVHVEENLETQTTNRNNVQVFKFCEKWKDGRPWLSAEDGKMFYSYCKEFDKTSRNKFISGCESMRIENVCSHEASNAHKTSHLAFLNSIKRPAEQPIVKALITMEKHNIDLMKKLFTTAFFVAKNEKPYTDFVIAFYQFITNDCTTPVEF